ncbi:MAG: hypothetical protein DI569_01290 [Sphingopyxis macrogoltabida]|uniref:TonB-dependent receptor n=1 Tax=Sphingopyxis macrogoltabida TaxID=33050 RepID=A0A2W5LCV8_SPHMC|nr:MAG: hypothetical protein DI569_01290 [Sphingopyxis macrogoltabida]
MRKFHRSSTALGAMALALAMAPAAAAQTDADPASDTAAPEAAADEATVAAAETAAPTDGDIVVTGSRLGNSGFTAPTPVTVLGEDQINTRAPSNIGDFLNEQPAFRNSSSPSQAQRSIGGVATTLDLRGLGPARTLTLVNGARFTPTTREGALDVGLIPTLLVERVDVVTGGASAAYGSDAVAGVVNFVLANKLDGVKAKAQYNVSERGDAAGPVLSFAAGTAFAGDRAHIVVGAEYAKNNGVGRIYERPWGRRQPGLIANGAARPAGTPASSFVTDVTYSQQNPGGLIVAGPLRGTSFGPNGTTFPFQYGTLFSTLMVGGDSYGNSPFGNWPILTPTERVAGLARISYDISDDTEVFAEFNYGRNTGRGYTSYNQRRFTIRRDNPFLPTSVRDAMVANNVSTIQVGRLFTENGGIQQKNVNETYRGLVGAKGTIFSNWDWDVALQYGRSSSSVTVFKNMLGANYDAAVDVIVGTNGQPACAPSASNPNLSANEIAVLTGTCVPLNIFGVGSPSPAAIDYITEDSFRETVYKRTAAAINLRGSPFATGAGDVQFAIGGEFRHDSLDGTADPLSAAGLFTSGNGGIFGGSQDVTEGFVELGVPLAADTSFAHSLDLNAAYRFTHYSTSGSVSTWKVGVTYEPTPDIRLRLTRSRDIRAPSLADLYATAPSGVFTASFVNPFNGRTGALNASTAGNLDLQPEVADTLTGGIVLTPQWDWARGFRFSVDGYRIKVKDVITNLNGNDVVNRCFAGASSFCDFITFDNSTFGIANVERVPVNTAVLKLEGVDIEAQYRFDVGASTSLPGSVMIRALATKVFTLETTDDQGTVDRAGSIQNNGIPSWTANVSLGYSNDAFGIDLSARYVSASTFDATFVGPDSPAYNPAAGNSININRFPSAIYVNLGLSFNVEQGGNTFQFFGGVDNLFDKQPPQYAVTGINSGGNPYDVIGRRFLAGVRTNF